MARKPSEKNSNEPPIPAGTAYLNAYVDAVLEEWKADHPEASDEDLALVREHIVATI